MKIKLSLLILIVMAKSTIYAQKTWSLDDCIAHAVEHNLELNDFKFNERSTKEIYRQSIRNMFPVVRGVADYDIRFGRSIDPNDNSIITTGFFSNSYSLESSVEIFSGFQKLNAIKAAKFLARAAKEEKSHQKYLLAFRVMEAFYDVQFFEGLIAISEQELSVSRSIYDLTQKQIEIGVKAEADLYDAESLLISDKLNLTQSKNQFASAKLKLIREMNLEGTSDIAIQAELLKSPNEFESYRPEADSIFKEAKAFIPIIKAQTQRTIAARKDIGVARGNLYPTLSLVGAYGTGFFETITDDLGETVSFRNQIRDNTFQFIGLSLTIPVTNAWSFRSEVKQRKIEYSRAQNNLKLEQQELLQTIESLIQEYNGLRLEYEQSTQKVKAQSLAFNIAQKRYERGLINTIELFTAKNLLASAQNENLQVQLRVDINKSTLDFYRGLPVFNIKMD